jgi:hypothetical protein
MLALLVLFLLLPVIVPVHQADAATMTSYQIFNHNLKKDLNKYLKKSGGTVTLHYRDISTGDEFNINSSTPKRAASTIKLPLALYIMEQAAANKINLNQKLVYKKHHYYGGSGVIQYDRVGSKYTIRNLVKKAMVHSDNIAFIMLKEKVGKGNFNAYLKKIGGEFAYLHGQNLTSSKDLVEYANRLYTFAEKHKLGKELVSYLMNTDYNTTIPKGIKGAKTAHKVGMIPMSLIYNDIAIVYDQNPFALALMTNNISYAKSQKVIAEIAAIVHKHHKIKNKVEYFKTKKKIVVYSNTSGKLKKYGSMEKNQSFRVISNKGKWYQIQFGRKKGYVSKKNVIAYSKAPSKGFSTKEEALGVITIKRTTPFLTNPYGSGKTIANIYKGASMSFYSTKGKYYRVIIGSRVGYVLKSATQLQYSDGIKYIQVTRSDAPIYSLINNRYIKIGTVEKGRVLLRKKGNSKFNELMLGSEKVYVAKTDAKPLLSTKITDFIDVEDALGTQTLSQDTVVYLQPTLNSAGIGIISQNQQYTYISKDGDWYEINFLGRRAFIKNVN